jgi:hypothetical protein
MAGGGSIKGAILREGPRLHSLQLHLTRFLGGIYPVIPSSQHALLHPNSPNTVRVSVHKTVLSPANNKTVRIATPGFSYIQCTAAGSAVSHIKLHATEHRRQNLSAPKLREYVKEELPYCQEGPVHSVRIFVSGSCRACSITGVRKAVGE